MKIPLSPLDYYFFRRRLYTIQFVFEYQGQLDTTQFEKSLNETRAVFPATGARIKIESDREITLETGFSIPLRTIRISTEPKFDTPEDVESLLDPVINEDGMPVLKILVTQSPSRSFVSISFSHMLGDGMSFFRFLSSLSANCLHKKAGSKPCDQRELLQRGSLPGDSRKALFAATGYVIPRPPNPDAFSVERIHYSNQELEMLKRHCMAKGFQVSTNDILMAELAKRFHRDIPLHNGQFIVRCPVEYRKILGLPSEYFGNAVRDALTILQPEEIETMDIANLAGKIRKSILDVGKESIEESLRCLNALREENGIEIFEDVGCPGLLVSNFSKFPIRKIDFGLGAPSVFHHASLNPRLALILHAQDGVDVRFKRPLPR